MERAEQAANIRYGGELIMSPRWHGFIEGYQQAEKDLALSWEDIRLIVDIAGKLTEDYNVGVIELILRDEQTFHEEVLRRFNEAKKQHK